MNDRSGENLAGAWEFHNVSRGTGVGESIFSHSHRVSTSRACFLSLEFPKKGDLCRNRAVNLKKNAG